LQADAKSANGFTLIPCQPKKDGAANILKKIQDLGWFAQPEEEQQHSPTVTHLHTLGRTAEKDPVLTETVRIRKKMA
jgi:hypothetical protein